jgi:hypothetical protein
MRYLSSAALMSIALAGVYLGDKSTVTLSADGPVRKGLEIHEWGVFTVHDDIELANIDMCSEWSALPKFFYGQTPGRNLPIDHSNIEVKKPVIFFHAPEPLTQEVRVDFPGGVPAVWWPRTRSPIRENIGRTPDEKPKEPYRTLEWQVYLKEPPKGERSDAKPQAVEKDHWVETLRAVKADPVFARINEWHGKEIGGLAARGFEREQFLYYDGLIPLPRRVALTVDKDKITVANPTGSPVFDLTVVDRRTPDHLRVARLEKLDAKTKDKTLELKEVDAKEWPAAAAASLTTKLKDAGLFEDEAKALADIWKKDIFAADGLTMFYRLPQEEYERLLPMKLNPRPEKLVRVGLILQSHCEPDVSDRVARLVKDLDDDDFETRERAQKALTDIGRAAFPSLKQLRDKAKSREVQRRLDELLDRFDAQKALLP